MNIWYLTKKHFKKGKTVLSLSCPYTYEQEKNINKMKYFIWVKKKLTILSFSCFINTYLNSRLDKSL